MTHSHKPTLKPSSIEQDLNTTTRVDIYSPSVPPTMIETLVFKFIKMIGSSTVTQRVADFILPKRFHPYGKLKELGEPQEFVVDDFRLRKLMEKKK